jgi:hypothetical protein
MSKIDNITLMMAIQAVNEQIKKYEQLLTSETLRDAAEIQELVFSYEKALEALRLAYEANWVQDGNLPAYDALVNS